MSRRLFFQSPLLRATAAVALLACSDSGQGIMATPDAPPTVDNPDAAAGGQAVLKRASRSSTIAISDDDKTVVMVNPQNDSISIFQTSDLSRTIVASAIQRCRSVQARLSIRFRASDRLGPNA